MYNLKRFMHILAQWKSQSSVRQRRRHTDVKSLTVILGAFLNR